MGLSRCHFTILAEPWIYTYSTSPTRCLVCVRFCLTNLPGRKCSMDLDSGLSWHPWLEVWIWPSIWPESFWSSGELDIFGPSGTSRRLLLLSNVCMLLSHRVKTWHVSFLFYLHVTINTPQDRNIGSLCILLFVLVQLTYLSRRRLLSIKMFWIDQKVL